MVKTHRNFESLKNPTQKTKIIWVINFIWMDGRDQGNMIGYKIWQDLPFVVSNF